MDEGQAAGHVPATALHENLTKLPHALGGICLWPLFHGTQSNRKLWAQYQVFIDKELKEVVYIGSMDQVVQMVDDNPFREHHAFRPEYESLSQSDYGYTKHYVEPIWDFHLR